MNLVDNAPRKKCKLIYPVYLQYKVMQTSSERLYSVGYLLSKKNELRPN